MSMSTTDATASDNKGTAYWQALDNAHHLHPFTDSAALHARGSRVIARAEREAELREREAERVRRAELVAAQLRIEADFLARRLEAQRELLRLAEMKYDQGEIEYEALARSRLAVLSAEHACATNAARLTTLDAGGDEGWLMSE